MRKINGGAQSAKTSAPLPEQDEHVEVQVRDTGTGISPRVKDRLFEPFVSSKETGLGLGLSICKRLLEAHGGAIRGANGSECGAVFTFVLPVETSKRANLETDSVCGAVVS